MSIQTEMGLHDSHNLLKVNVVKPVAPALVVAAAKELQDYRSWLAGASVRCGSLGLSLWGGNVNRVNNVAFARFAKE